MRREHNLLASDCFRADEMTSQSEHCELCNPTAPAAGEHLTAEPPAELPAELPAQLPGPATVPGESPTGSGDSDIAEQNGATEAAGVPAELAAGPEAGQEESALDRAARIKAANLARLEKAHAAAAAARAAGGAPTYDWEAIRRRYVEGVKGEVDYEWPSLDAVAAHFGCPPTRVREKSGKEGWRAQRTQWQAQVEATRRQARAAALAREATNLDGSALNAAKLGLQLAQFQMARIGQQRDVVPPDAQEMQRWAQAIDLFHKIGLRAIGDPEVHRIELTGANGAPIEIATELRRDDPNRLVGVLGVLAQAGLGELFAGADPRVLEGELAQADR